MAKSMGQLEAELEALRAQFQALLQHINDERTRENKPPFRVPVAPRGLSRAD